MRLLVKSITFAGALCLLTVTPAAADGILLVSKSTSGGGAPQTSQIQIDGRRMRAEVIGERGEKSSVVFDGTRKLMLLIDDSQKTVTEMTEADLSQISGMMAQMEQQMKNLPPEQRAQFDAMMKGRGAAMPGAAGAAAPKVQYTKTGTATVGKWTCDKYEGSNGGQKVSEVCTVDPKVLGFTAADFAISRDFAAFFKKVMPGGGGQTFSIGTPEDQGFSGVPVRTVSFGGRQVTTEITEVSRQVFPDSIFQAPAGYQKQSTMGGRGRR